MFRMMLVAAAALGALLLAPAPARSQASPADGWRPPSAEMPRMPAAAALQGDWQGAVGGWMQGVDGVAGVALARVRATGEGTPTTRFVRFASGPFPVAAWSDRNGDGRADLIELYRGGTVVLQLVDADYDGRANAVRYHDTAGKLVREERM